MQIGSTELIVILILIVIAYSFYRAERSSSARPSPDRQGQQASSGPGGEARGEAGGFDDAWGKAAAFETAGSKNPYAILNLPTDATEEDVVAAYRRMAQMYHPDKVVGLAPEYRDIAERKMKDINAAYEQLRRRFEAERAAVR